MVAISPSNTEEPIAVVPGEIHLWLAYYDAIADEELHGAYRQLLSEAERHRGTRFYFAKDRRRYLVTRAMVRVVLSRYARVRPHDWMFSENAYGRPEAANAEASALQLCFNLSHTDGLIVLGVTRGRALGIDTENVKTREAAIRIAGRFFAPSEVAALGEVHRDRQPFRFFEYWTFKESYIKARGMGLHLPLHKFSFHFPDEHSVRLEVDAELADAALRWQLWQWQPTAEHLVAICAERLQERGSKLIARRIVPMREEELLESNPSRASR